MAPPGSALPRLVAKAQRTGEVQGEKGKRVATERKPLPPRRRPIAVACQNCRTRKINCGGVRPQCHPCTKASLDCIYDTPAGLNRRQAVREQISKLQATVDLLRQDVSFQQTQVPHTPSQLGTISAPKPPDGTHVRNISTNVQASADLVALLRDQPEVFALEVLQSLKAGLSPTEILRSIGGNLSQHMSPSAHTTARGTSTPTRSLLEFRLNVQFPKAYPSLIPLDVASLDLQLLGIKPLHTGFNPNTGLSNLAPSHISSPTFDKAVHPQHFIGRGCHGIDDFFPMDERLQSVDITRWTTVAITNRFAAEAITLYLSINQPFWAFFDADLFLDDLISVRTKFCSRMLVNAVLAWASQSYAHYEPMAAALSAQFLDEALRIYDAERGVDSLTTVAATSLMSMTWTTLGKDKVGRRLQVDSARMGERLQLYGESSAAANSPLEVNDESVDAAACATAWGSFNFQMVMSMSYYQEPIPKRPPKFRIPDKVWISTQTHDAPRINATFTAICQFWLIIVIRNYLYYSERSILISSAVAVFQRLLEWADALPAGVGRSKHDPDYVLNLQEVHWSWEMTSAQKMLISISIWFHTAIIDMFRPFEYDLPQPRLPAPAGMNATPKAVIAASIEQLKHLIYRYRANYESAKYSIVWQSGMLYLVNHILRDSFSNEAQFYFLLCMRGYQYLARYMPFVSGIMQSLIVMAKLQGGTLTDDAQKLLEEVRGENHRSQEFFSTYPVDLEMASKDPSLATMERLASCFQEQISVLNQREACKSDILPAGWKGSVEDLAATLLEPENSPTDHKPWSEHD